MVALPAGADAQGAVDEALQLDVRLAANPAHLIERQLAGQDHAGEPDLLQEFHLLHGGVVHLRAGDQRQGRQIQFQQADVLHDQAVDARLVELMDHLLGRGQLVIAEQRVQGHVDAGVVLVGESHHLLDGGHAVACGLAGAEPAEPRCRPRPLRTELRHVRSGRPSPGLRVLPSYSWMRIIPIRSGLCARE